MADSAAAAPAAALGDLLVRNMKRTFIMFADREGAPPPDFEPAQKLKIASRIAAEYAEVREPPAAAAAAGGSSREAAQAAASAAGTSAPSAGEGDKDVTKIISRLDEEKKNKAYAAAAAASGSSSLVMYAPSAEAVGGAAAGGAAGAFVPSNSKVVAVVRCLRSIVKHGSAQCTIAIHHTS
jgi:hypothetical protein